MNHLIRFSLVISLMQVAFLASGQQADTIPIFSFGLLADVQYANAEQSGKRDYRGSLQRLRNSLAILNDHDLEFLIHAGDLIDRDYTSFDSSLNNFKRAKAQVHFVVGNHEFSVADSLKSKVRKRLNNPEGYYAFVLKGFQFVLLDAMDVSVHSSRSGTRQHKQALAIQAKLRQEGANNAYDWNGAIGDRQIKWLRKKLRSGERKGYKTVLFSHLPLLPENGLQLWNNGQLLSLLDRYPSVVAFISGHHHEGGYVKRGHIHHLTLKGLVEASTVACAVARVFTDRIDIRGFGDQRDHVLSFQVNTTKVQAR